MTLKQNEFFYQTYWGKYLCSLLEQKTIGMVSNLNQCRVLEVGLPFFIKNTERTIGIVTNKYAENFIDKFPPENNIVVGDCPLPFMDRFFDVVIFSFALEFSQKPKTMLREAWRVLADGGNIIIAVPNISGLWTFAKDSPYYQAESYTTNEIKSVMADNLFAVKNICYALPSYPLNFICNPLAQYLPFPSGIIVCSATKNILAPVVSREKALIRKICSPVKNCFLSKRQDHEFKK